MPPPMSPPVATTTAYASRIWPSSVVTRQASPQASTSLARPATFTTPADERARSRARSKRSPAGPPGDATASPHGRPTRCERTSAHARSKPRIGGRTTPAQRASARARASRSRSANQPTRVCIVMTSGEIDIRQEGFVGVTKQAGLERPVALAPRERARPRSSQGDCSARQPRGPRSSERRRATKRRDRPRPHHARHRNDRASGLLGPRNRSRRSGRLSRSLIGRSPSFGPMILPKAWSIAPVASVEAPVPLRGSLPMGRSSRQQCPPLVPAMPLPITMTWRTWRTWRGAPPDSPSRSVPKRRAHMRGEQRLCRACSGPSATMRERACWSRNSRAIARAADGARSSSAATICPQRAAHRIPPQAPRPRRVRRATSATVRASSSRST